MNASPALFRGGLAPAPDSVHLSSAVTSQTSLNSVIVYLVVVLQYVHWHKLLSVFKSLMQIGG